MANDCCGCCDCAFPNQLEIARLRADLSTARERGEALARALKRADDALTWALDKSPEACATMVKESAPFRCEARAALRAWEEGR